MHQTSWVYWEVRMNKQILLCVETNKKARTDYQYVVATIKRFYQNNRKIIYKPIFLDSKTKYNSKNKVKEINNYVKKFPGETSVIYFIDVDDYDTSYETKKLYDDIKAYCDKNEYDFVFFTKDIEDVYWGKQVGDNEKVKKVEEFNRKQLINEVDKFRLQVGEHKSHCSNILNVFDKYWVRK